MLINLIRFFIISKITGDQDADPGDCALPHLLGLAHLHGNLHQSGTGVLLAGHLLSTSSHQHATLRPLVLESLHLLADVEKLPPIHVASHPQLLLLHLRQQLLLLRPAPLHLSGLQRLLIAGQQSWARSYSLRRPIPWRSTLPSLSPIQQPIQFERPFRWHGSRGLSERAPARAAGSQPDG
jgi:hypothetical protein